MDINVYGRNPFPTAGFPDTSLGHREGVVGQDADYQAAEGGNNFGPRNHPAEDRFPFDYNGLVDPDNLVGLGFDNPVGDDDSNDPGNQTDPDNLAADPDSDNYSTGPDCPEGGDPGGSGCQTGLADNPAGFVGRIDPADCPEGGDPGGSGCQTGLAGPAGPAGPVDRIGLVDNPAGVGLVGLEYRIGRAGR